eukprot:Em0009g470a
MAEWLYPFVLSVDGLLHKEASHFIKHMATALSSKCYTDHGSLMQGFEQSYGFEEGAGDKYADLNELFLDYDPDSSEIDSDNEASEENMKAVNCALTDGKEKPSYYTTTKKSRRIQYFEALDLLVVELEDGFEQKEYINPVLALEELLLRAAFSNQIKEVNESVYKKDFKFSQLQTQLLILPQVQALVAKVQALVAKVQALVAKVQALVAILKKVQALGALPKVQALVPLDQS